MPLVLVSGGDHFPAPSERGHGSDRFLESEAGAATVGSNCCSPLFQGGTGYRVVFRTKHAQAHVCCAESISEAFPSHGPLPHDLFRAMVSFYTILVVDDEPALRDVILSVLSEPGHTALGAADGYEALRIMAERRVDLLITDLVMPGLSGYQLARQAKVMRPRLHVIYISAYPRETMQDAGLTHGVLMKKPFRAHELVRTVDRELGTVSDTRWAR